MFRRWYSNMSSSDPPDSGGEPTFRAFTAESLSAAEARVLRFKSGKHDEDEIQPAKPTRPDESLEDGMLLSRSLFRKLDASLIGRPLEEIDEFYADKKTYLVINKRREIFRFNATKALFCLSPFNPVRRAAVTVVSHPIFSYLVVLVFVVNCVTMSIPATPTVEAFDLYVLLAYVLEAFIRIIARGFTWGSFTYAHMPWNQLDLLILGLEFFRMSIDVFGLLMLRGFRAFRMVAAATGFNLSMRSFCKSIRNMKEVAILAVVSLALFSVLGLQVYMGVLSTRCIDSAVNEIEDPREREAYAKNTSNHFYWNGISGHLCGSDAHCPANFTCMVGYGENPDYGYTNFDNFASAYLSSFRIMTQDYWEDLFKKIYVTAGTWHSIFFVVAIFFFSFYVLNLITATVIVTYSDLWKKYSQENEEERKYLKEKSNSPDDQENKGLREKCKEQCERCCDCFCVWNFSPCCISLQRILHSVVFHPFAQLFIVVCISLYIIIMALDHHNMSPEFERFLSYTHQTIFLVFVIEAALKIVALSPKYYFQLGWNKFEFFLVFFGIVNFMLEGVQGISIIRTLQLLFIWRIFRYWSRKDPAVVALSKVSNQFRHLSLLLILFCVIFSVLGKDMFGRNYIMFQELFHGGVMPRWNFTDFTHSFMTVFRAMCGEWIETMWDCLRVQLTPVICVAFYIALVVIGRFVLVNLFLGMFLIAYDIPAPELPPEDDEYKSYNEVKKSIANIWSKTGQRLFRSSTDKRKILNGSFKDYNEKDGILEESANDKTLMAEVSLEEPKNDTSTVKDQAETSISMSEPPLCCPDYIYRIIPACGSETGFFLHWKRLRTKFNPQGKCFEAIMLVFIILSTVHLTIEDAKLMYRPALHLYIAYMNIVFAVVFFVEMLIKLLAFGFKKYLTDRRCWLEFLVVLACIVDVFTIINLHHFRILRLFSLLHFASFSLGLRGVRDFCSIWYNELNSAMFSVFPLCFTFWLLYAIIGVQVLGGKFYHCVDENFERVNITVVDNRMECYAHNFTWIAQEINFNSVINSFLALFQVATFKGWIDVIYFAQDARLIDDQPVDEGNLSIFSYFVSFVILGVFFSMNLISSTIIHTMKRHILKTGDSLEDSADRHQKRYLAFIHKINASGPQKVLPRPPASFRATLFDLVTSLKFEVAILIVISLNIVVMAIDHFDMQFHFHVILAHCDTFFTVIYIIEAVLKIIALRSHYFRHTRNVYDFFVVIMSVLGIFMRHLMATYFISPSLLRLFRIFEGLRLLPFSKKFRGISQLLATFSRAVGSLVDLCLLYALICVIYAVFGMHYFMFVRHSFFIDEHTNFETFQSAMAVLLQVSTGAAWDGALSALGEEHNCDHHDYETGAPGSCGNKTIAIIFLVSYVIINYIVLFSAMLAVVLYSYIEVKEEDDILTGSDLIVFYERWKRSDPEASGYIQQVSLAVLLDSLSEPLRIPSASDEKLASLEISSSPGNVLHCKDVLAALVRHNFRKIGIEVQDTTETKNILNTSRKGRVSVGNFSPTSGEGGNLV